MDNSSHGVCDNCRQITPKTFLAEGVVVLRHKTFTDVQSAQSVCRLCALIVKVILQAAPSHWKPRVPEKPLVFMSQRQLRFFPGNGEVPQIARLTLRWDRKLPPVYFALHSEAVDSVPVLRPSPVGISLNPIPSLQAIKEWLTYCINDHDDCKKNSLGATTAPETSQTLPPRLYDITNSRLWEPPPGSVGTYVILSYVWGDPQYISKTLITNRAQRLAHLGPEHMPQTYRRAISIAKELGQRYLWIDALCIVQDDSEDMKANIHRMGEYYSNAIFTLVATCGRDSTCDFGFDAQTATQRELTGGIVQLEPFQENYFISQYRGSIQEDVNESYWDSRGWCFQERILSRRLIHFTGTKIYVECGTFNFDETGFFFPIFGLRATKMRRQRPEGSAAGLKEHWYLQFIPAYTRRLLSFESDKLNAIMGIGKEMEKLCHQAGTPSSLLYGLWSDELHVGLCWQGHGKPLKTAISTATWNEQKGEKPPDPANYPPTWSWAAWKGEIAYEQYVLTAEAQCTVHVTSSSDRRLRVTGRLVHLKLGAKTEIVGEVMGDHPYMVEHQNVYLLLDPTIDKAIGWTALDLDPKISGKVELDHEIECLLVSVNKEGRNDSVKAGLCESPETYNLLVVGNVKEDEYERLGVGEIVQDVVKGPGEQDAIEFTLV